MEYETAVDRDTPGKENHQHRRSFIYDHFIPLSESSYCEPSYRDTPQVQFLETSDWKASFFQLVPQRKRTEGDSGNCFLVTRAKASWILVYVDPQLLPLHAMAVQVEKS
ncbi:hypothetical protein V6N11_030498 [Hibiscus sabdariffa]|uniref:Uncharacterized protein n=1 Tax=Hibiscus sabdariffa TaxID=183260 RepID=A0ABR2PLD9_9ROSI